MKADLLEAQEKHDREIRRLGNRALKERRNEEYLKELTASGVGEKLLDAISADTLETIGKKYAKQARKAQKMVDGCFILARGKRRKEVPG